MGKYIFEISSMNNLKSVEASILILKVMIEDSKPWVLLKRSLYTFIIINAYVCFIHNGQRTYL